MWHDRKVDHFRPEPIPTGGRVWWRISAHAARRHVRACRLVMFANEGSNGGTPATPVRQALGDVASR